MEKITILIVDDHALIREAWTMMLQQEDNFSVLGGFGTGESAIEGIKALRPKIVLLDINMSPVNGFDVLSEIKRIGGTRVIAISMYVLPVYAKRMLKMGAHGYLTKNSSREEMITAINEVVKGNFYICDEVKKLLADQVMNVDEDHNGLNHLSQREIEVINFLKDGLSSKEIAEKLGLSIKTVEVHRHNILKKLKVKNTASLINFIHAGGW